MKWRILDGPSPMTNTRFVDGDLWGATIENVNDPAQRRLVQVVIAGTVLQSDKDTLLSEVRDAVDSSGQTAIEKFLDEQQPPDRILVSSAGVHTVGTE